MKNDLQNIIDSKTESECLIKIFDNIQDDSIKEALHCFDENNFKPEIQEKLVKFSINNNNQKLLNYLLEIKSFDFNIQYNVLF